MRQIKIIKKGEVPLPRQQKQERPQARAVPERPRKPERAQGAAKREKLAAFFAVVRRQVEGTMRFTRTYTNFNEAKAEAMRLSKEHNGVPFYVIQSVGCFRDKASGESLKEEKK
jgi:hypothetical protein